jgi:hypothetical protein
VTTPRLHDPVTTDGARRVNFFNGRLLSAEDLRAEHDFAQLARRRLASVAGDGVVTGLRVTAAAASSASRPAVSIAAGLAVNRTGDPLAMPSDVVVDLTTADVRTPASDTAFGPCAGSGPGGALLDTGVYLLVIRPAGVRRGRAPSFGLGDDAGCATDAVIEGVAFDVVALDIDQQWQTAAALPILRSRVAHLLAGTADPRRRPDLDPLGVPGPPRWGRLDDLRDSGRLPDDAVPLAVLSWVPGRGLEFVDSWAARRRPTQSDPGTRWQGLTGDRARADAEALLEQFQDQVVDLVATGRDLTSTSAAQLFEYLPPVAVVPVTARPGDVAFDRDTFLGASGSQHIETLDAAELAALLDQSLVHRPQPVGLPATRFRRYWVYENLLAVTAGSTASLAMVIAARHLARRGTARFGFAVLGASSFPDTVDTPRQEE